MSFSISYREKCLPFLNLSEWNDCFMPAFGELKSYAVLNLSKIKRFLKLKTQNNVIIYTITYSAVTNRVVQCLSCLTASLRLFWVRSLGGVFSMSLCRYSGFFPQSKNLQTVKWTEEMALFNINLCTDLMPPDHLNGRSCSSSSSYGMQCSQHGSRYRWEPTRTCRI